MASPKICTPNLHESKKSTGSLLFRKSDRGFTLIEMLIVMGILGILGGTTLVFSFQGFRQYAFQNDRDAIVAALHKARSQAINNMCLGSSCEGGLRHGVDIGGTSVTIFQLDKDGNRDVFLDEVIQLSSTDVHLTVSAPSIVFEQLSGNTAVDPFVPWVLLMYSDGGKTSQITVNAEGRISWTN